MGPVIRKFERDDNSEVSIMSSFARHLPTVARVVLGGIFFVFGLNGFLQFLSAPPIPPRALAFIAALGATGYMFPIIKGTEVIAGALLLSNRYVPLALTLLAPIIVNITLFHTVLAPSLPMTLVILAAEIFLAWSYRKAFAPMLARRVKPEVVATRSELEHAPAE
jgi:hypothetical protein